MYETDNQISEDQINLTENKFDNNEKKKRIQFIITYLQVIILKKKKIKMKIT
jgi:hypothetical protein